MNIQVPAIRNADDFLRWNEGREGKREFVRGRVVEMMVNVSRNHARLAFRVMMALGSRLASDAYDIGSADFGVKTRDGVRFPDVFVERSGGGGKELATHEPLLLAEILSPSSIARDFGEKVADYTSLPSLLHYLVLSQDEPRVWLWARSEDGTFGEPLMVAGTGETLELAGFDVTIPLAELYRGIA